LDCQETIEAGPQKVGFTHAMDLIALSI